MKGGKYITEGSYGAVFDPPIESSDKNDKIGVPKNSVGKVFFDKESADLEHNFNNVIKNIDKDSKWTVKYYGRNVVKFEDFKESDEYEKGFWQTVHKNNPLQQLVYEYGGKDLATEKMFKKYITFEKLLNSFVPILEGLENLAKLKYVHQDIKPPNMLHNLDTGKTSVIDFGLMAKMEDIYDIKKNEGRLSSGYRYYPTEYYLTSILNSKDIKEKTPEEIAKKLSNNFTNSYGSYKAAVENITTFDVKDVSYKFSLDILEEHKGNWDTVKMFSKYANKIDIYSVGISLCYLLYKAIGYKKVGNINMIKTKELISKMMYPDPRERYSPKEATEALKALLGIKTSSPVKVAVVKSVSPKKETIKNVEKVAKAVGVKNVKKNSVKKNVEEMKKVVNKGGKKPTKKFIEDFSKTCKKIDKETLEKLAKDFNINYTSSSSSSICEDLIKVLGKIKISEEQQLKITKSMVKVSTEAFEELKKTVEKLEKETIVKKVKATTLKKNIQKIIEDFEKETKPKK